MCNRCGVQSKKTLCVTCSKICNEKQNTVYHERRKAGKCVWCGVECKTLYCETHRTATNEKQKNFYRRKKEGHHFNATTGNRISKLEQKFYQL